MKFAQRINALKPSETKQFQALVNKLTEEGHEVIDFGHGDTDTLIAEQTISNLTSNLKLGKYKYSSSQGNKKLLSHLAKISGVEPENIIVGSGAKLMLDLVTRLFVNPNDDVVLIAPYWPTYATQVEMNNGNVRRFSLGTNLEFNKSEFTKFVNTLENPRMIILNNPNNPSGKVFSIDELETIAAIAKEKDMLIVSDEVYSDIVFDGSMHISLLNLLTKGYDLQNFVVINSGSKNYGMSGFRISYLISSMEIVKKLVQLTSQTVSNVPEFTQLAYLDEMENKDHHKMVMQEFTKRHTTAKGVLKKCKNLKNLNSLGSIYFFPEITKQLPYSTTDFAINLLNDKFVSVLPGTSFGWDKNIRISIGKATAEKIEKGIIIIDNYLESLT